MWKIRFKNINYLLVIIILVTLFLRLYDLGGKSLAYDEIYEMFMGKKDISYIIGHVHPLHSPLNQIITHCFLSLGKNDVVLRLPSVLWGVLSVGAIYLMGKLLFGKKEGLFAAFLLCISPYHIRYSQEGRMYTLLVLAAILSMYFFWQSFLKTGKKGLPGYIITSLLALYTQFFAVFILLSQLIFLGLGSSLSLFAGWGIKITRKKLIFFFAALLIILIAYSPQLVSIIRHTLSAKSFAVCTVAAEESALKQYPQPPSPGKLFWIYSGANGTNSAVYATFFFLGILGSLPKTYRLALLYLLVYSAIPFVCFLFITPTTIFSPRYFIFLLPVCYLLIARGMAAAWIGVNAIFSKKLASFGKYNRYITACFIPVLFLILDVKPLSLYYRNYAPWSGRVLKTDLRSMVGFLGRSAQPGDAFLLARPESEMPRLTLNYYLTEDQKKKLFEIEPQSLNETGAWRIGFGRQAPIHSPDFTPVKINQDFKNLGLSFAKAPVTVKELAITNSNFAVDRGEDYGWGDTTAGNNIPDGWELRQDDSQTPPGYSLDLIKEDYSGDNKFVKVTDHVSHPHFTLASRMLPVSPGKRYWFSTRIKGSEDFFYLFSPGSKIVFLDSDLNPISHPHDTGFPVKIAQADGWELLAQNGFIPSSARYARIVLYEVNGWEGKISMFSRPRFFIDSPD